MMPPANRADASPQTPGAASSGLVEVLRNYWGYDGFLPLQQEAMQCVLEGRDSVVVLPTGGGKSLCYQAPAMCLPGLAVVVSPLISLMKDQVDALRSCGVPAACVNSTLSLSERRRVADEVRAGSLKLLYLAPERLVTGRTLAFLKESRIAFFAIDEAHCISAWGHDFRPEYRALRVLKTEFAGVGVHAYTATATERVRRDIVSQLGLDGPRELVGSFDRPNLVYRVLRRLGPVQQVREVVDRHRGESGIVYCISRKNVENTAAALAAMGYRARPYHAGLSDEQRHASQEAFLHDEVQIIVATVAFGMGIDKPNVRYVVHAGLPKSLEAYQQESGRAGRDGLEAECVLLYSDGDVALWKRLLAENEPAALAAAKQSLQAMADYAGSTICRHRALLRYFGEELAEDCGQACDVCREELALVDDPLVLGQKILSCVVRLEERFGGDYTALVLTGSREQRILRNGHEKLSTWGLLSDDSRRSVRDWIEQLVAQRLLEKRGEYHQLNVTEAGWEVLRGEKTPRLLKPRESATQKRERTAAPADSWDGVDRELFETLRELRREQASERGVPAYIVFGDAALRDMARRRPTTLDGFREVKGVGERKLQEYGEAFVAAITEHCRRQGIETDVSAPSGTSTASGAVTGSGNLSAARGEAFELFRQERSLQDVAAAVDRAPSTTLQYLVEFLAWEKWTDPTPWVSRETSERIEQAAHDAGMERLRPIFERLDGEVSYEDIRVVVACLRNREEQREV